MSKITHRLSALDKHCNVLALVDLYAEDDHSDYSTMSRALDHFKRNNIEYNGLLIQFNFVQTEAPLIKGEGNFDEF